MIQTSLNTKIEVHPSLKYFWHFFVESESLFLWTNLENMKVPLMQSGYIEMTDQLTILYGNVECREAARTT